MSKEQKTQAARAAALEADIAALLGGAVRSAAPSPRDFTNAAAAKAATKTKSAARKSTKK